MSVEQTSIYTSPFNQQAEIEGITQWLTSNEKIVQARQEEQPLLRGNGTIDLGAAIEEVTSRNTEGSTHFDRTIWLVESETKTVHLTGYRPDEIEEGAHMHESSNYLFIVGGQFRVGLLNSEGEWTIQTMGPGTMLFFEPHTPHLVAPVGDDPDSLSIIMVMTFPGVSTRPDAQYNLPVPESTPPLPEIV